MLLAPSKEESTDPEKVKAKQIIENSIKKNYSEKLVLRMINAEGIITPYALYLARKCQYSETVIELLKSKGAEYNSTCILS